MSGAILPLPQYVFMAWCSVKAQEQLYFYFTRYLFFGVSYVLLLSAILQLNLQFYFYPALYSLISFPSHSPFNSFFSLTSFVLTHSY
jgi:hypothetical protein